jgi:hypothetical protein
MKQKRRFLFIVSFLVGTGTALAAPPGEDPGGKSRAIQPVLPLNEGVLTKLKGLKENEAISLGEARVVGEFNDVARRFNLHRNGPMARDFTIKMVWAPERRRALFCGANHGVPHRLNDVWEFDLGSLTWAMLYAPDNPRDYTGLGKDASDVEFKDGLLITRRGGPAVIAHTWWGLTYDPKEKALLFMNTWVTNRKKCVEQLGGDPSQLYQGPPLWAFYPETRRWKAFKTSPPHPVAPFGGLLEYVPELDGTIWHTNNWKMRATWLYNAQKNAWKDLKANAGKGDFQKQAAEPEQVGYYDPVRKIIVAHRHKTTYHFNPRTREWKKVLEAEADSDKIPYGHDARAPLYHDPVSGHGLLVEFRTGTVWSYDPDRTAWTKLSPRGPAMPQGRKPLAYIDPAHNVLVVIQGTKVWAYRYRG